MHAPAGTASWHTRTHMHTCRAGAPATHAGQPRRTCRSPGSAAGPQSTTAQHHTPLPLARPHHRSVSQSSHTLRLGYSVGEGGGEEWVGRGLAGRARINQRLCTEKKNSMSVLRNQLHFKQHAGCRVQRRALPLDRQGQGGAALAVASMGRPPTTGPAPPGAAALLRRGAWGEQGSEEEIHTGWSSRRGRPKRRAPPRHRPAAIAARRTLRPALPHSWGAKNTREGARALRQSVQPPRRA